MARQIGPVHHINEHPPWPAARGLGVQFRPDSPSTSGGGEVEAGVHVEAEPPVGVDVRPEQRGQSAPVFLGELSGPGRVAQDRLEELGVDEFSGLRK